MVGIITALVLLGILMLCAELFVPGLIVGILGFCAIALAIVLTYVGYGFGAGNLALGAMLVFGVIAFVVWLYVFPRTPFARVLTLDATTKGPTDHPDHAKLIGRQGVALTTLRPSGTALIDGQRVDVVAESEVIDKDEKIVVLFTEGMRVVVRRSA